MPPKKQQGPSSKADAKQKAKIIEDKTFGLKNKNKSKKVAKYVSQVQQQVLSDKTKKKTGDDEKTVAKKKKEEDEQRKAELAMLIKPVQQVQKLAPGVDPKSILCQFFKAGSCQKGAKCKFSHDLDIERKAEKIDLYSDRRLDKTGEDGKAGDTMENWDQAQLEEVVKKKQKGALPETDIVCKYFLDAVEKSQYGWFWECPNGAGCHYRHALPPGFTLKRDKKKEDDTKISIDEFIETERHRLTGKLTPVTAETFAVWKATRKAKKEVEERELREKKEAAIKAGKGLGGITGRDLFTYKPELFVDDEDAGGVDTYVKDVNAEDAESDDENAYLGDDGGVVIAEELLATINLDDLHVDEDDDDDDDEDGDGGGASSSAGGAGSRSRRAGGDDDDEEEDGDEEDGEEEEEDDDDDDDDDA